MVLLPLLAYISENEACIFSFSNIFMNLTKASVANGKLQ